MALAVEQANTPSFASFPGITYTWDRLEIDISEVIMSKALPKLPLDLSREKECEALQLQLGSSGQDHIWGSFLKVPHTEGILDWVCELQEWELIVEEKVPLVKLLGLWTPMIECWLLTHGSEYFGYMDEQDWVAMRCGLDAHPGWTDSIEDMVAVGLPDCRPLSYDRIYHRLNRVSIIRSHLRRWSMTRLHRRHIMGIETIALTSMSWYRYVSPFLMEAHKGAQFRFNVCSPWMRIQDLGLPGLTQRFARCSLVLYKATVH